MICDEHGEWECSICFSSNPDWESSKPYVPLTKHAIRMAIQHIKTSQGVRNARRRNQKEETSG